MKKIFILLFLILFVQSITAQTRHSENPRLAEWAAVEPPALTIIYPKNRSATSSWWAGSSCCLIRVKAVYGVKRNSAHTSRYRLA